MNGMGQQLLYGQEAGQVLTAQSKAALLKGNLVNLVGIHIRCEVSLDPGYSIRKSSEEIDLCTRGLEVRNALMERHVVSENTCDATDYK